MNRSRHNTLLLKSLRLFTLTFVLSVSLSLLYLPIHAQTEFASPYELLVEEIRVDIERRVNTDAQPLSHAEIEKLYFESAEAAGLKYKTLINLYETEYENAKIEADRVIPGWGPFKPNLGWLIGLLSLGTLAYTAILRKWIEDRLQQILDWLYTKLSGTRLLRNLALRKYRAALVASYSRLTMPFLQNQDPLRMEEVYVPLKITSLSHRSQINDSDNRENKQELIDTYRCIKQYDRLMIVGRPGSGKSVLLKNLAWSYGSGKLNFLVGQPTVLLLELYRISRPNLNEKELIKSLVDVFNRNRFPNSEKLVLRGLESGSLMLLLDGLDEVNSDVRKHVVSVLRDLLTRYRKCKVVITCRTAAYNDQFSDIFDQTLEVVEFSDQQMRRFLKAWEPQMPKGKKSVNQMIATLRDRPLILTLARNPLLLTLVSYLYTEPGFVLPRSRAEFFKKSTDILLEQQRYKGDAEFKHTEYEASEKRRVLQDLALYVQDHSDDLEDRRSLTQSTVIDQVKEFLPNIDISEEEAVKILEEITQRSGLFVKIDAGERYLFPHQTIQEYFAAASLIDEESELIERFKRNPSSWQEVVKLWCNLAQNSTSLIRAVYEWDKVTGFECLAEARRVDPNFANEVISFFKHKLDEPIVDETLTRSFGAVAANDRQRGQEVFSFLKDVLVNSEASSFRRRFAVDALSRTNLPEAAAFLIEHYETLKEWESDRASIVRMGDLVVDGLANKVTQQTIIEAIEDIYAIGTPSAATVLVPLMWNESSDEIAIRSAWYLGSLLARPEVEEALKDYPLNSEQRRSEEFLWLWEPFIDSHVGTLPIIAGKIAYAIQTSQKKLSPVTLKSLPNLDPRLVVPLCIMALEDNQTQLPKTFPLEADVLLEQAVQSVEVTDRCQAMAYRLLGSYTDSPWKVLIRKLGPTIQLDLLNRLVTSTPPLTSDSTIWRTYWLKLNNPDSPYSFRTSWHYLSIVTISLVLSIVSIFRLALETFLHHNNTLIVGLFGFVSIIITTFWVTLWQDSSGPLAPDLFFDLGPKGLLTFTSQLKQAVDNRLIWPGISMMYDSLTGKKLGVGIGASSTIFAVAISLIVAVFGAAIFTVTGNPIGAAAGAGAFVGAVAGPVAGAVACAVIATGADDAGAGAGAVSGAVVGAAAGVAATGDDALLASGFDAEITTFGAIIGVFLSAFVISAAVATLETWYKLELRPRRRGASIFAIFAFPWFCWFPIVILISLWVLFDLISHRYSEMNTQTVILITTLIGGVFTLICHCLWQRGQKLDSEARNPFRNGLLGQALGTDSRKSSSDIQ